MRKYDVSAFHKPRNEKRLEVTTDSGVKFGGDSDRIKTMSLQVTVGTKTLAAVGRTMEKELRSAAGRNALSGMIIDALE